MRRSSRRQQPVAEQAGHHGEEARDGDRHSGLSLGDRQVPAIGVSRLTGMNSEATSVKVISDMQITAPQGLRISAIRLS